MNLLLWGLTLGTIGKLVLGIAVLLVHIRIFEERSIDGIVLRAIRREHVVTIIGIILIIIGYVLEVMFYSGSTEFFECSGDACAALIRASFSE